LIEKHRNAKTGEVREIERKSWNGISRMYTHDSGVTEEPYIDKGGNHTFKSIKRPDVNFPPMTRAKIEKDLAREMLHRDGSSDDGVRGSIMECRPPTEFEPAEDWKLEDLQLWFEVVGIKPDAFDKVSLLHQAFYYVVNPAYTIPTKEDFEAYKQAKMAQSAPQTKPQAKPQQAHA
jgi:hypothetical protein